MSERKITPVKDSHDKRRTYAKQKARYCSAMKYGFYLEAMMIDYALLEDRLRSVLYHIGFLPNRKAVKVWKNARPYFTEIVKQYKTEKENDALDITNISGKIKIVRSMLLWVANTAGGIKLDTMFVDEGFGSLDEESLAAAMKALTSLADGNRLVGIIFHVGELKQKIDKQIIVKKDKVGGSYAEIVV